MPSQTGPINSVATIMRNHLVVVKLSQAYWFVQTDWNRVPMQSIAGAEHCGCLRSQTLLQR